MWLPLVTGNISVVDCMHLSQTV